MVQRLRLIENLALAQRSTPRGSVRLGDAEILLLALYLKGERELETGKLRLFDRRSLRTALIARGTGQCSLA